MSDYNIITSGDPMASIKVKLIKIGNSRGIRLSKSLIEQYALRDEVILEAGDDCLILRPAECPRTGWDKAFERMHQLDDDELLDPESIIETEWDKEDWVW